MNRVLHFRNDVILIPVATRFDIGHAYTLANKPPGIRERSTRDA